MILPSSIPHSLRCPSCQEHLANLKWDLHITTGSKYLSYYCDNCKNGFTTTASDTISLKHYHSKKRSVYRKNKINKLDI
jgi:protein-arginine kinase activator protein McsA